MALIRMLPSVDMVLDGWRETVEAAMSEVSLRLPGLSGTVLELDGDTHSFETLSSSLQSAAGAAVFGEFWGVKAYKGLAADSGMSLDVSLLMLSNIPANSRRGDLVLADSDVVVRKAHVTLVLNGTRDGCGDHLDVRAEVFELRLPIQRHIRPLHSNAASDSVTTTPSVADGRIAFVGPAHVPDLEGFTSLLIVKVHGTSATVQKTGPDSSEETPEFEVKIATLRHRLVRGEEAELWPGSYVGHPIAFVQTRGEDSEPWTYGLVTGYSMQDKAALLHVRFNSQALRIQLTTPPTVIVVDRLNYALSTGATVNVMNLNALELLDRQNEVRVACGKSRSGLPASVVSTMLSMPFKPNDCVPLIRPDTLEIVSVRRQHIVDCELNGRNNNPCVVFTDPQANTDVSYLEPSRDVANGTNLTLSDSDDEGKTEDQLTEQADINSVRLQNRSLRKRPRAAIADHEDLQLDDVGVPVLSMTGEAHASAFCPSEMEKLVHDAVAQPSLLGKNAHVVVESAQQGPRTKFMATPPVLRLAYDLSFGIRGLSLMHFRRFIYELEHADTANLNMTNFGRSNKPQPPTPPTGIRDIVEAFDALLLYAEGFYNSTVVEFFRTGAAFMTRMAVLSQPDATTCMMVALWIDCKLGKFRSELVASNIQNVARIGQEFTRNDNHLMEMYQALHDKLIVSQASSKPTRGGATNRPNQTRTSKPSTVPRELLAMLPKQGNKALCMRYLSKKGCTGPSAGN
ncbi:hypothetical protein PF001_g12683 [Phytophthora fragariae]|uniref:Uncharacterized protein n=1 Tax=Phytophthora fragariae TaxID=53985 RepID=A0A6A4DF94_9STRA|nr:hypothetical protein PF001_g12683 [Phytophthora fragariae]